MHGKGKEANESSNSFSFPSLSKQKTIVMNLLFFREMNNSGLSKGVFLWFDRPGSIIVIFVHQEIVSFCWKEGLLVLVVKQKAFF